MTRRKDAYENTDYYLRFVYNRRQRRLAHRTDLPPHGARKMDKPRIFVRTVSAALRHGRACAVRLLQYRPFVHTADMAAQGLSDHRAYRCSHSDRVYHRYSFR